MYRAAALSIASLVSRSSRPSRYLHTMMMTRTRTLALLPLTIFLVGCGDDSSAQTDDEVRAAVENVLPEVERAVKVAVRRAGQEGIVCVTGSCYTVADALRASGVEDLFSIGVEAGGRNG